VGRFERWFRTARWDEQLFDKAGLNPLMWAIDTLLLEYQSLPPEPTDAIDLANDIRENVERLVIGCGVVTTTGTASMIFATWDV
jgi:hypothetical protein